jgi:FKBP-type peptidyl-prolyl cis-trans isomerase
MEQFTPLTNDRGLYKKILREGNGTYPDDGDTVWVQYKGVLEDGTLFDQSHDDENFNFILGSGEALHGWEVGIKSMRRGEKSILVMRSDYAYGSDGYLIIPPEAPLIFYIELVDFKKNKK